VEVPCVSHAGVRKIRGGKKKGKIGYSNKSFSGEKEKR